MRIEIREQTTPIGHAYLIVLVNQPLADVILSLRSQRDLAALCAVTALRALQAVGYENVSIVTV